MDAWQDGPEAPEDRAGNGPGTGAGGPEPHACRYAVRLVWSGWHRPVPGSTLAERSARRVPVCRVCGAERPSRRPRPAVLREMRAEVPEAPPLADATGRAVAAALVRHGRVPEQVVAVRGLLGDLARRAVPASLAEEWIERFLRAGWLAASRQTGGSPRLVSVTLRRLAALRELAQPGADARRSRALAAARAATAGLVHPKAAEIAALLGTPEAEGFPPALLKALAALAAHAETGEVLAERVFSARHLDGSKALAALRGRLERLVGPLAEIGIRDGAGVSLIGGHGALRLAGRRLELRELPPFLGLARETLHRLEAVTLPPGGLLVVENLAAFEACCRGEIEAARDALLAWSAGYPAPALRQLVRLAGETGGPLTIWADLDLDGVRIARLLASWAPSGATFYRMTPADLAAAPRHRPLGERGAAALRRELAERPTAPLADTLRAILDLGRWAEQEAFLAPPAAAERASENGGASRPAFPRGPGEAPTT